MIHARNLIAGAWRSNKFQAPKGIGSGDLSGGSFISHRYYLLDDRELFHGA
jgi:hypothetical protein